MVNREIGNRQSAIGSRQSAIRLGSAESNRQFSYFLFLSSYSHLAIFLYFLVNLLTR
jgi:hypothetical protein